MELKELQKEKKVVQYESEGERLTRIKKESKY